MTHIPAIRWNRLLTIAIATILLSLGSNHLQNLRGVASHVPEKALLAQEVSTIWEKGSFPVENFQSYTSPFGYRASPIDGRRQFHNGLDLAAPRGSYIRNWWGGRITKLSDNTACGTSVTIQSGSWSHSYCHMEGHVEHHSSGVYLIDRDGGIQLTLGQDISVGARIGRVGMTGRTTGPHLHWVLKHNGNYVDPGLVLKEMFKRQTAS